MKNGNTIFFILFTANFIVAILSACAYIFSWTLLIPFILLTIVVCSLNCAMLKKSETKRNLLYAGNCVCNCNFNCGCDNKL